MFLNVFLGGSAEFLFYYQVVLGSSKTSNNYSKAYYLLGIIYLIVLCSNTYYVKRQNGLFVCACFLNGNFYYF